MSQIAIVTGGNSGIGRACAAALARAGLDVGLTWHAEAERAREAVEELQAIGVRAEARQVDLHDAAAGARTVDELAEALGGVDVLVNNAGYGADAPFLEATLDDLRGVLEVNLVSAFACAQAAARRMVAAGRAGAVVNIASILGERIMPGVTGYTAAKAGLVHLTRQMAVELARHRIRVNAIAPGYVETDINRDFFASDAGGAVVKRNPQRRLGTVEDLTGPLLLLASEAGAHMTGSVLTVDGGHSVNSL